MLSNIKLIIEYKGKNYCGWQSQGFSRLTNKTKKPIQQLVENALAKILGEKIRLYGSGRTDSQVNALGQVANFRTKSKLEPERIKLALNTLLPRTIRVIKAEKVPLDFHSRFSARGKFYRYIILNQRATSAIFDDYCYLVKFPLNIALMRKAAEYLRGRHNFKAFCSSGSNSNNTIRTIYKITISTPKKIFLNEISRYRFICIDIHGDGFLYNMVRNIVGTLIEIGRGRYSPDYILKLFKEKNRQLCGPCVPAKGLYLCKVEY